MITTAKVNDDIIAVKKEFIGSKSHHNQQQNDNTSRDSLSSSMLQPEEEVENEVRRADQDNINKFARLNARLHEVRDEKDLFKKSLERLDDASTELMMQDDNDKVMLLVGESFFETAEEDATEYVESEVERLQSLIDKLEEEEAEIIEKQGDLKKILYGRFGKSIQLEDK